MLVPRSYRYSSSPPPAQTALEEKRRDTGKRLNPARKTTYAGKRPSHPDVRPQPAQRTHTEPVKPATRPVDVPLPDRCPNNSSTPPVVVAASGTMPTPPKFAPGVTRSKSSYPSVHKADSLPPAMAALLAVTEIPRPKPNHFKRRLDQQRRISIDELVNSWKLDDSMPSSFSTSPGLSLLLEDSDEADERCSRRSEMSDDDGATAVTHRRRRHLRSRSKSSDSIPMLIPDDNSVVSGTDPSTPGSLRSRRSSSRLRKEKPRSLPSNFVDQDHPLLDLPAPDGQGDPDAASLNFSSSSSSRTATPKPKSSFKSNLTSSLQALKNAAISSISSLTSSSTNQSPLDQLSPTYPWSDEMLWAHPYLFPRFGTEVRPAITGTPSKAQRRYLNPPPPPVAPPLTFEEQEAPFQQALHAPYLAEQTGKPEPAAPTIQMQTYSRGRRRSGKSSSSSSATAAAARNRSPDPQSEAGRALLAAAGTGLGRTRETRENSDFLRIVVLEMNMRREGKLEVGRARICLPPRQEGNGSLQMQQQYPGRRKGGVVVPTRWVGISAE